jgi:4-amino-4-deoxy-L-arabinose transferase-like glycosyltransferase
MTKKQFSFRKAMSQKNKFFSIFSFFLLGIIIFSHLFFGLYHLGKEAYVDEKLWTYSKQKRIEKYWNNIKQRDWYHTRPSDKPGITLAFISAPSLFFVTPSNFKEPILNKKAFEQMLWTMRLPILFISTLSILLFYYIIKKTFNNEIALLSSIFIGLSPILLGISRIINPDALSWIFIPLALLAYLSYQKNTDRKTLYLTGFFLGLALLTKYIANILFPIFISLIFIKTLFEKYPQNKLRLYLKKSFSDLVKITLTALITFTIFYPGVWIKPSRILLGTIWSQAFASIWQYFVALLLFFFFDYYFNNFNITLWLSEKLNSLKSIILKFLPLIFITIIIITIYYTYFPTPTLSFESILYSPKTSLSKHRTNIWGAFITSFYVPLFSFGPIVFLGTLLTSFFSTSKIWSKSKKNTLKISKNTIYTVWSLMFFIFVFYGASLLSGVIPTLRYQIALYPLWLILASFGWYCLWKNSFNNFIFAIKTSKQPKKYSFYFLLFTFILFGILTLQNVKPFYFSYNSPLLPPNQLINPKDMGDGSYEIAQYLNSLPDAKNLNIWSDRRGVCSFFIGNNCNRSIKKQDFIKHGPDYDFFIVSKAREYKEIYYWKIYGGGTPDFPLRLDLIYKEKNPIFIIPPGHRQANYIKVVSGEKFKIK